MIADIACWGIGVKEFIKTLSVRNILAFYGAIQLGAIVIDKLLDINGL